MRWSRARGLCALGAMGILLAGAGMAASRANQGILPGQTSPATGNIPTPAQTPSPPQTLPTPTATPPAPAVTQTHAPPAFFVMIDPAHGGDDRGAVFAGNLLEKDITLALARRLKTELQERGVFARLLRDADVDLSLEQRAENANEQHASVYVALHAGMPGQGVRVYAPALASFAPPAAGKFALWNNAQADSLARSQDLAQRITSELGKKDVNAIELATPLRPLNNVIAPAVAIELAPDPNNVEDIMGQKFQTTVAAAIAVGIGQLKPQWEEPR